MRRLMLVAALLAVGSVGHANDDWTRTSSLGLAAAYMDYRETDVNGRQLDREHGALPGITAAVQGRNSKWSAAADLSYFDNDIQYEATNSITSRTDERLVHGSVRIGMQSFTNASTHLDLYAGGGLRWWNRDIRSIASASGLDETYSWPYLMAGLTLERALAQSQNLRLDLSLLHPVNPQLQVNFKNGYDSADVSPEARLGGRLGLSWMHPLPGNRTLTLSLWHEQWRFDASDSETLRRNGIAIGTLREPESKTDFTGLGIALGGWNF